MSNIPPWLVTMRAISGTKESPGRTNNPVIMRWVTEIAQRFPEMASYCRGYTGDSIPWCGLTVAYVLATNGIRPAWGNKDTDRFLWADSWSRFGRRLKKPILGCIMVFARSGGGHVTLYEREDANYFYVRGGNQSDMVNLSRYPKSKFSCAVWPLHYPLPGETKVNQSAPQAAVDNEPEAEPVDESVPVVDPAAPAPVVTAPPVAVAAKPLTKSKTIWGGLMQWFAGVGAVLASMFQFVQTPLGFAAFVIVLVLLSIGLYLVIKGRLDVHKIVTYLDGDATAS